MLPRIIIVSLPLEAYWTFISDCTSLLTHYLIFFSLRNFFALLTKHVWALSFELFIHKFIYTIMHKWI